jgi:enolase
MAKIASGSARVINDSRGESTIEVTLEDDAGFSVSASVPQGKSKGSYEAASVDAPRAVSNVVDEIVPKIRGMDAGDQEKIDAAMCALDGTPNKSRLGGNAILAVSIAAARLGARAAGIPLWRFIAHHAGFPWKPKKFPKLFVNIINGGLHAKNNLDFQEYIVIPRAAHMSEAVNVSKEMYKAVGAILEAREGKKIPIGDEGGFMPSFKDNGEPFEVFTEALKTVKAKGGADFGLDAAASNIKMEKGKLAAWYERFIEDYKLVYLEDPFPEDDFASFTNLAENYGSKTRITGDDLTVTNVERMKIAHEKKSVNGVIIKPNQIGTISEAMKAVRQAREWGWWVVVSHRSGETMDDFVADFACGVEADGFKLGAPFPPERMAKYNRLLAIEKEKEGAFEEMNT